MENGVISYSQPIEAYNIEFPYVHRKSTGQCFLKTADITIPKNTLFSNAFRLKMSDSLQKRAPQKGLVLVSPLKTTKY